MRRRAFVPLLVFALGIWPWSLRAQGPAVDPDLTKGIKQVDDGEYDAAILTLDAVARRLATQPSRTRDLSQAYLYLGIAYVGKGQEAAARARFREALGQARDLTLSPDTFPPKVINLFEAAKEEIAGAASTATPAQAASASASAPAPQKKGGGSKALLVVGGLAVVGGGVALAAGGGGGSSSAAPTTTTLPADTRKTDVFSGSICGYGSPGRQNGTCSYVATFDVVVSQPGTLDATVVWSDGTIFFDMILYDQLGAQVVESARTSATTSQLTTPVTPQTACSSCAYHMQVSRGDEKGLLAFTLTVHHP